MAKQPLTEITPHIGLLGRMESNVHWVHDGGEGLLLGGGMTYIVPDLLDQMQQLGIEPESITRLVILHSHFDHVGIAPFVKKRFPWVRLVGSARAQSTLAKPQAQAAIGQLNAQAVALHGDPERVRELGAEYAPFGLDEVVGEGDEIRVGGLALRILEAPGHSSCSVAAYLETEKALFPSDAAGTRVGDFFLATGNSDFALYEQSLRKLGALGADIILPEHYGALVDAEARDHFPRAMREAAAMRHRLEESYRRTRDVAASTRELTDAIVEAAPGELFPRPVLELVIGPMVRFTARQMDAAEA